MLIFARVRYIIWIYVINSIINRICDILVRLRAREPYSTRVAGGYPYTFSDKLPEEKGRELRPPYFRRIGRKRRHAWPGHVPGKCSWWYASFLFARCFDQDWSLGDPQLDERSEYPGINSLFNLYANSVIGKSKTKQKSSLTNKLRWIPDWWKHI